jgi:hypothetical protein
MELSLLKECVKYLANRSCCLLQKLSNSLIGPIVACEYLLGTPSSKTQQNCDAIRITRNIRGMESFRPVKVAPKLWTSTGVRNRLLSGLAAATLYRVGKVHVGGVSDAHAGGSQDSLISVTVVRRTVTARGGGGGGEPAAATGRLPVGSNGVDGPRDTTLKRNVTPTGRPETVVDVEPKTSGAALRQVPSPRENSTRKTVDPASGCQEKPIVPGPADVTRNEVAGPGKVIVEPTASNVPVKSPE